eukprot:TRINITY_DN14157_c0_g1_i1.p1 TRINITY_DN14157_c0_g1~~TRINITY_DN14157_c0_g1_i1.p1  ORF type:complete len:357 (+),score=44.57 TRINITY_DN14157_c0_g1_i1:130-1200(+)
MISLIHLVILLLLVPSISARKVQIWNTSMDETTSESFTLNPLLDDNTASCNNQQVLGFYQNSQSIMINKTLSQDASFKISATILSFGSWNLGSNIVLKQDGNTLYTFTPASCATTSKYDVYVWDGYISPWTFWQSTDKISFVDVSSQIEYKIAYFGSACSSTTPTTTVELLGSTQYQLKVSLSDSSYYYRLRWKVVEQDTGTIIYQRTAETQYMLQPHQNFIFLSGNCKSFTEEFCGNLGSKSADNKQKSIVLPITVTDNKISIQLQDTLSNSYNYWAISTLYVEYSEILSDKVVWNSTLESNLFSSLTFTPTVTENLQTCEKKKKKKKKKKKNTGGKQILKKNNTTQKKKKRCKK